MKQKANQQWVWIAMDKQTRQSIAFHVGDRSHNRAKQLWANLPAVYREQAKFSTDQYAVYTAVMPAAQHKAITKKARKTNHLDRFNHTLRQRVSRLVRDTPTFSKKLANHSGAITYFLCHGNRTRVAAFPVEHYQYFGRVCYSGEHSPSPRSSNAQRESRLSRPMHCFPAMA